MREQDDTYNTVEQAATYLESIGMALSTLINVALCIIFLYTIAMF